ncbi:N-acetyltransferase [Streptomyces triticagri]|uniref:N-acetyltransferase n=1 Tax=Streptomyces triticagri TaxID=2293568 RepID=A0A372MBB6_9ACTN|nr:N-acetyltransferase [Streptomyces triticagri]RFU88232.1 N-acetyltransferase [Streptomyces triticagri]
MTSPDGLSLRRGPCPVGAVRFLRAASPGTADRFLITALDLDGRVVGRLDYRLCHGCRAGYVDAIAITGPWQGYGLGREAVTLMLGHAVAYRWSTSRRSLPGRRFFAAMAEETGVVFEGRAVRCTHLR